MMPATWISCAAHDCPRGQYVDLRHVDNLTAGGGWLCSEHHDDETQEVPRR